MRKWLTTPRGMTCFLIVLHLIFFAGILMPASGVEGPSSSSETLDGTPIEAADYQLLIRRIEALEARIAALESEDDPSIAPEIGEPTEDTVSLEKPILYVRTEEWCSPCRIFKSELEALKADYQRRGVEFPIEVAINPENRKWSGNSIPQFSYVSRAGQQSNLVGYTRGQLARMIERMVR